ncbi:MAG: hypothetical protein HPY53_02570 [Brevinematales bacterium]|nr:hypothetical protein [Brevinematales bacterium]
MAQAPSIPMNEVIEEAQNNLFSQDAIGIMFNNLGLIKFKNMLTMPNDGSIPLYTIFMKPENTSLILDKVPKLFPYTKGITLKLTAPQKRRKLITYLNDSILDFIDRMELETSINIIHELTANGEKANLENIIVRQKLATNPKDVPPLIRNERDMLLHMCNDKCKWAKISWKFTHKIFKIEVKNNTPIDSMGLSNIKDKVSMKLNTIADGFIGEIDDKIGAGLGLFFVNFFKDEMKEKYDFETIFRVYESDFGETIASLTVMFEKN